MSKVTEGLRTYFGPAPMTEQEYGQYASEEMIDRVISKLEASDDRTKGKVCYVFGTGSQPKSTYTELESLTGISLVQFESLLPWGLRFIPSYRGLVKINEKPALGCVMRKLMNQSTAIALIFDATLEEAFVASVRTIDMHGDHSFGIRDDPGHMIYLVDGDRDDAPTGMVHFLSYKAGGPWKEVFDYIAQSEGRGG